MEHLPSIDEMTKAYLNSDASYNGVFYVAVRTTKIFCLPSCSARKPFPKNVEFFGTPEEAMKAGYRACKRCKPMESPGTSPQWVDDLLDEIKNNPEIRIKDADLTARGLNPATVRRYFHKQYGMSFQDYSRSFRMGKALEAIQEGANLDDVALGYGYESHSGFREAFSRTFGQAPGQSRDGNCIVTDLFESPFGPLVMGATKAGVCLLEFPDMERLQSQLGSLQKYANGKIVPGNNEHLEHLKAELNAYFAGELNDFTVPVVCFGTEFQQSVWSQLQMIPYGETRSYEDIAIALGNLNAQRAVGMANGSNRISIVIPCHRVVNKSGKLGGYGGGLWRKNMLLRLEQGEQALAFA